MSKPRRFCFGHMVLKDLKMNSPTGAWYCSVLPLSKNLQNKVNLSWLAHSPSKLMATGNITHYPPWGLGAHREWLVAL